MDSIYKIFTGEYIDLERIVLVSPPVRYYDMDGDYAVFAISFQLMEKPLYFRKWFTHFSIHAQCNNDSTWQEIHEKFEGRVIKYDTNSLRYETELLNKKEFEIFTIRYEEFLKDYKDYKSKRLLEK